MIPNLIFGILFLKILFRTYSAFIFVQTSQWTSPEVFLNFRFLSRKSQSQQKLAEKITHFTIRFRSTNLTHFTNLNSLDNFSRVVHDFWEDCLHKPKLLLAANRLIYLNIINRYIKHSRSPVPSRTIVFYIE